MLWRTVGAVVARKGGGERNRVVRGGLYVLAAAATGLQLRYGLESAYYVIDPLAKKALFPASHHRPYYSTRTEAKNCIAIRLHYMYPGSRRQRLLIHREGREIKTFG